MAAVEAAQRSDPSRPTAPTGHSSVPPSSQVPGSSSGQDRASLEREMRRQKERFLMFTRVLMKYLEQKDPQMHQKAKLIIKDCAERNKRQERGYESVTASMRSRLKQLVGEQYWKRAESYLKHFLEQRAKGASSDKPGGSSSASSSSRPGVPGASSTSASSHHQQEQARKLQQQQQLKKQQQQQQQQQQQHAKSQQQSSSASQRSSQSSASGSANVSELRKEIQTKRQALQSKSQQSSGSSKSGSTTPTSGKGKTARRKSGSSPGPSSRKASSTAASAAKDASGSGSGAGTTTPSKQQQQQPSPEPEELPPREFKDLMEMVDHAVDFDFTTAGLLLSGGSASSSASATKQQEKQFSLSEEQRNLLYGLGGSSSSTKIQTPQSPGASQTMQAASDATSATGSTALTGWGKRNILSPRAAWARVRLREHHKALKEQQQNRAPVVADGLLTLPGGQTSESPTTAAPSTPGSPQAASSPSQQTVAAVSTWVNDEQAEQDATLTLLSEGCQAYIKGILEKAIHCARQRQNLDGVRLWHEQMDAVIKSNDSSNANGTGNNDSGNGKSNNKTNGDKDGDSTKPALSLRLGCDVSRQHAQASGNAAMICKRMEEALERLSEYVPERARSLDQETLSEATSMADLAMRPLLSKGVERADYQAKRSFEVYGGKYALEPPLGRVPKQAKLEVIDFVMGSHLNDEPGSFHRAETSSLSMLF